MSSKFDFHATITDTQPLFRNESVVTQDRNDKRWMMVAPEPDYFDTPSELKEKFGITASKLRIQRIVHDGDVKQYHLEHGITAYIFKGKQGVFWGRTKQ